MKKGLLLSAILSALSILMWHLPNRPQAADITMPGTKFTSLSYAPYQAWQSPLFKTYPTSTEVLSDLKQIAKRANGIRTYSSVEGNFDIAALAKQCGLHVWLGIWLSSNPKDNAREISAAIAEANAHPDTVTRVVVGNEVLLRRDLSVQALEQYIDYVRAHVKQPVAYADVTDFWRKFPQIASHVDIVMIHFLPYWENHPLGVHEAIASIQSTTDAFKKQFPGKQISIGETGWPSRGRWRGDAAPSRVNEAVYLREFVTVSNAEHVDYNLIEAFDQPWKYQDEGVAGASWGIWNAYRIQKFPLSGGVVEHPDWFWYAIFGASFSILLFSYVGFQNLRLAVPSFVLGNGFSIACAGTLPLLYDKWLMVDALINLPLQAIFAFEVIKRAEAILSGRQLPAQISSREVFATIRRCRFPFTYEFLWSLFLTSACIFQALLIFDPRYRDAPTCVFIIPVIAAAFRLWTKDKPYALRWEDLLAANLLAIGALISALQQGSENIDFLTWNVAAIILAAPILLVQDRRRHNAARL